MGTFNIATDVCVDGEKQEFAFKWTADAEQIRHLVDRIENMAVRADVTSQVLVLAPCVGCLPCGFMRKETISRR